MFYLTNTNLQILISWPVIYRFTTAAWTSLCFSKFIYDSNIKIKFFFKIYVISDLSCLFLFLMKHDIFIFSSRCKLHCIYLLSNWKIKFDSYFFPCLLTISSSVCSFYVSTVVCLKYSYANFFLMQSSFASLFFHEFMWAHNKDLLAQFD